MKILPWGSVVKLAWLLNLLNVLSAVVSSESKSLVLGVGSSAASSPAGPVPLAAITLEGKLTTVLAK